MTRIKLVLCDIDHTLIQTGGVGREVFGTAFERATGRPMREMADPSGLTEPTIFEHTLALHGIPNRDDYFPIFAKHQASAYRDRATDLRKRGRVLPGVLEALREMHERSDIVSSVLTGNPRPSAIAKLQVFDLDGYLDLDCGAYGDDDPDRAELVRIAWQRAEMAHHQPFDSSNTVIIGDTPKDVAAGHANAVYVVGVASGKSTTEELRDAGADAVIPSLRELGSVQVLRSAT